MHENHGMVRNTFPAPAFFIFLLQGIHKRTEFFKFHPVYIIRKISENKEIHGEDHEYYNDQGCQQKNREKFGCRIEFQFNIYKIRENS